MYGLLTEREQRATVVALETQLVPGLLHSSKALRRERHLPALPPFHRHTYHIRVRGETSNNTANLELESEPRGQMVADLVHVGW